MYPLKFRPILKQTLWGGDKIISFKKLSECLPNVGECWDVSAVEGCESVVSNGADSGATLSDLVTKYKADLVGKANYEIYGNKFPLLVKFIDANQDLSIQVHPNNFLAKRDHGGLGKNEMWYLVDADKKTKLVLGFSKKIAIDEYEKRVQDGTLTEVLNVLPVSPGDVYYVPAGRIHSIGSGAFIVEIQQTSDITYRIFDYNRKDKQGKSRELHIKQAMEAIDFSDYEEDAQIKYQRVINEPVSLMSNDCFTASFYEMTESITCDYSDLDSFVIFICIGGDSILLDNEGNQTTMCAGETILLPAQLREVVITPGKLGVKFIETYV